MIVDNKAFRPPLKRQKSSGSKLSERQEVQSVEWNNLIIGDVLGMGEFGEVLEATVINEQEEGRKYVLKRLKRKVANHPTAQHDFTAEYRILSQLSHSNIISLRASVGEIKYQKDFGLILERLSTTLDEKMQEWKMSPSRSLTGRLLRYRRSFPKKPTIDRIMTLLELSNAMKFLHERRILFRDLKPANVGFGRDGEVKLYDFGLAKELLRVDRVDVDAYRLTCATGTPRYMAPEVQNCLPYGKPADVYSFALLSWEVATLSKPFPQLSRQQLFVQVVQRNKRPSISSASCLSKKLQQLTKKCWSDDPTNRPDFDTIFQEFMQDLTHRLGDGFKPDAHRTAILPRNGSDAVNWNKKPSFETSSDTSTTVSKHSVLQRASEGSVCL